jgi:hypothetical protein
MDLWSVDDLSTHPGAGEFAIGQSQSWFEFNKNIDKYGLRGRVFPTCSTSEYLDNLPCHEAPWPYDDAKRVAKHLTKDGVMLFHDAMRYWAGPEYETDMKQEDYVGHGWGGNVIPGDRMQVDPWQGVADGINQLLVEGEFESIDKAHGMMVLRRKKAEEIETFMSGPRVFDKTIKKIGRLGKK